MMDKDNRGEINLYRKKRAGIMAYKATKEHLVYCASGSLIGSALVPVGYFVTLDEFGRSEQVLSPGAFHKVYELEEREDND